MKNNYSVLACFWQECIKAHLTDGKQKLHFIFMNFKWESEKGKETVSFLAGAFLHNLSLDEWVPYLIEYPSHWLGYNAFVTRAQMVPRSTQFYWWGGFETHKKRAKHEAHTVAFFWTRERKRINGHVALMLFVKMCLVLRKQANKRQTCDLALYG